MTLLEPLLSGLVATAALDLWQRLLKLTAGLPPTSWALVGRWWRSAMRGLVFPGSVAALPEGPGELRLGWTVHYLVGVGYGVVYVFGLRAFGADPASLWNGLLFGAASVVVPWFFFMPAMGAGLLARRTPRPALARTLALAGHTVFGLGLALGSGWAVN
jgi:hypothetical protein